MRIRALVGVALLAAGCTTLDAKPAYLTGSWGGEHIGLSFEGALGTLEYDCASGTIDSIVLPAKDGRFTARGIHRPGQGGPVRVGQVFRTVRATYAGEVKKDLMTLNVTLEDGTRLGPFTLVRGASPQTMRCL